MCHWHGFTVRTCGFLGTTMDSSAMDMKRGTGTLFEFLCLTIAPQNFSFLSYPSRKMGFWLWNTNSARFLEFHTWKRHFVCPTTVLVLWSPQRLIKCSKRRFVPHILWWDGDPATGISPQILGGITPTQFLPYIRHLGESFSPLYKSSSSPDFPNS